MQKHKQNNSDTMELNRRFLSMEVVCVPLNWQKLKQSFHLKLKKNKKNPTAEETEL